MSMTESYFAHSAKGGHRGQGYGEHVERTTKLALRFGKEMKPYCRKDAAQIENILGLAAAYHDLGKLDRKNQAVLRGEEKAKHLPVNHKDAGAAFFKQMGQDALVSLMLEHAHHGGLPDSAAETNRSEAACFRDRDQAVRDHVDRELDQLARIQKRWTGEEDDHTLEFCKGDPAVFLRMLLSCLADADHSDTASVYGASPEAEKVPDLQPERRLEALNRYAEEKLDAERIRWYRACRDCREKAGIVAYNGFGESEKNTAVMAYQLSQAAARKARRIFVVLPYADQVTQAAEVYRHALKLPEEKPEEVVAELHDKANYERKEERTRAALWRAPIVVATAASFFETLASNRPGTLRPLHELPGSVILADGAYAGLPLKLLPLAWRWIKILEEEWSCHWILGSGALIRFWQIPELVGTKEVQVLEMVNPKACSELLSGRRNEIRFCWKPRPLGRGELADLVMESRGPRLLIMNTVQNAAVIAEDICEKYGRDCVEHLSSALMAEDYKNTKETIKKRLADPEDKDWVLVATSCAEALDHLSFCTGFREMASVLSLLQAARIIDGSEDGETAEMWSFGMQDDLLLAPNPEGKAGAGLLKEYLHEGLEVTPKLCQKSVSDAFLRGKLETKEAEKLIKAEENLNFKTVNDQFQVIERDSVPVIVSSSAAGRGRRALENSRAVQKCSVSIPRKNLRKWKVEQAAKNVYRWTLRYDSFLGYMAGVLDFIKES